MDSSPFHIFSDNTITHLWDEMRIDDEFIDDLMEGRLNFDIQCSTPNSTELAPALNFQMMTGISESNPIVIDSMSEEGVGISASNPIMIDSVSQELCELVLNSGELEELTPLSPDVVPLGRGVVSDNQDVVNDMPDNQDVVNDVPLGRGVVSDNQDVVDDMSDNQDVVNDVPLGRGVVNDMSDNSIDFVNWGQVGVVAVSPTTNSIEPDMNTSEILEKLFGNDIGTNINWGDSIDADDLIDLV